MSQQSNNWRAAAIVLAGAVIVVTVALGLVYYTVVVHASGTVSVKTVNCAVFFDSAGTQPVTSINWGTMPPDSAVNATIYLKNTGNTACNFTIISMNFSPANAGTWISLTYDLKGALNVPVNSVIPCVLTDSISPNITGITFYSYDIQVTASG